MKAKLFAIGLLLFALAACVKVPEPVEGPTRNNTPSLELQSIDTQMWHQPDSALMRLLPWFDTCCRDAACHVSTATAYNRHYANLLLSELLYKNDYPQTNRRELQQAAGYFDSLTVLADTRGVSLPPRPRRDARRASAQNIAFLDARAHYINGVGYYENDSVVEACKEYMKALGVMEDHFEEKDMISEKVQFMALTYTRLTIIFSDLYLHDQAIFWGKQALSYYKKQQPSSWQIAWIMDEIGSHYDMMEKLDSANYYYQHAREILHDTNDLMYRDIDAHSAYLSYKKEGISQSIINQFYYILNHADNVDEYLARCFAIGGIYYREQLFDSAWVYLNRVYENTESMASKKQSAEWLVDLCKVQGRDTEINEFANFLVPFANLEENQSAIKSQLTEMYKVFVQEKLENENEKRIKENTKRTIVVVEGLSLIIIVITFFYYKSKKSKHFLEEKMKEEKKANEMKQKALSGRLKKSNETLRVVLKKIEEQEAKKMNTDFENKAPFTSQEKYRVFMQTQICFDVLEKVEQLHADKRMTLKSDMDVSDYKSFALSTTQLATLSKTVETHFPELYVSLKAQHNSISQKDWRFCLLYLLQLDKLTICVLLQESYHTCRRYTMKLEQAFQCKHGLSAFLLEQIGMI